MRALGLLLQTGKAVRCGADAVELSRIYILATQGIVSFGCAIKAGKLTSPTRSIELQLACSNDSAKEWHIKTPPALRT